MDALFDRVGGNQFFVELIDAFYLGVAGDPLLRPLYPDDLTEGKEHLALFLAQYWAVHPPTTRPEATPDCGCAICHSSSARPSETCGCAT